MLPTRCETSTAFCSPLWPGAVAAAAIDSPPSLIRSKRRVHASGQALDRLHGIDDHIGRGRDRARNRPRRRVGEFLGLAHLVELGQRVDLRDAHMEHVDAVDVEGAEVRPQGEPGQESNHGDALIHGEVGALEQLRGDQVLRLQHGRCLVAGLGPRGRRSASVPEDNEHREGRESCFSSRDPPVAPDALRGSESAHRVLPRLRLHRAGAEDEQERCEAHRALHHGLLRETAVSNGRASRCRGRPMIPGHLPRGLWDLGLIAPHSGNAFMKYIAPMSWPAVVIDPNHFSKIGATSPERYRLARARLTDSRNAASPRRSISPYGS